VAITSIPIEARRVFAACLLTVSAFSTSQAQTAEKSFATPGAGTGTAEQSDLSGIRPSHIWTFEYLKLVFGDTKAVLTAPASWDQEDWRDAAIAFAGVGATAAFDQTIRTHVQARRTAGEDRFMKRWQEINTFYILGGFEAWGELGGDIRAKNVAMDGLAASLIASGLITPGLKLVVGRERPNTTSATFKFRPFSGNYSFPSGHTTQAFVVATVIAENYPTWWVEGLAYGSAALVGYARIEQNAHFASDVIAGSLIGWSVARAVVHRNNGPRDPRKLNWSPYTNGRSTGILFFKTF
jgi:hypothetical protein